MSRVITTGNSATENNENPANTLETSKIERTRIPMSLPIQKLAVPPIPGYHLHWMRGDAARVQQALRAGYEFVNQDEVDVTNTNLADNAETSGSTDMGSRVSIVAGSEIDAGGQPERLFLMKLRQEYWEEDQAVLENRNEEVAAALRGGATPGNVAPEGAYIPQAHRKSVENMFTRKR
jgi:hypothetical protein